MLGNIFDSAEKIVWSIVGLGITIAVAYWILSIFLPLDEWLSAIMRKFSGEKKRCSGCKALNPSKARFCVKCGKEF